MSQFLADQYMKSKRIERFERALRDQEHLRDWYERRRMAEMQAEQLNQARMQQAQVDARETFFANLNTRRLDLQNSIALYPLSYEVWHDWQLFCGVKQIQGRMLGASMAKTELYNKPHASGFNARYIAYDSIGAMCNDANPQFQVLTQIAVNAFYHNFHSNYRTSNMGAVSLNDASRYAHFIMGLAGSFAMVGERSTATPFLIYWGLPQECKERILREPTKESVLFNTYCPNDVSLADDLIRMREIYSISRYILDEQPCLDMTKPLAKRLTVGSQSVSVQELMREQFSVDEQDVIIGGIEAMTKVWLDEYVSREYHQYMVTLHEKFPLIYIVAATLLLLQRINAPAFHELSQCFGDVSQMRDKLPSSYVRHVIGLDRYFPEQPTKQNYDLFTAMKACNISVDDVTTPLAPEGHIIPRTDWLPVYQEQYDQLYSVSSMELEGDLAPFYEPVKVELSHEFSNQLGFSTESTLIESQDSNKK